MKEEIKFVIASKKKKNLSWVGGIACLIAGIGVAALGMTDGDGEMFWYGVSFFAAGIVLFVMSRHNRNAPKELIVAYVDRLRFYDFGEQRYVTLAYTDLSGASVSGDDESVLGILSGTIKRPAAHDVTLTDRFGREYAIRMLDDAYDVQYKIAQLIEAAAEAAAAGA